MGTIEIICTVIGAVATILGGVWFIISKAFKTGQVAQRIDSIEEDISAIRESVEKLPCGSHHEDITKIKTIIIEKYPKSYNIFSIKCSPRRLNDLGEKLYEKIKGDEFIDENKSKLFDFIKKSNPLVELDVEQAANSACMSLVNTPSFNKLKNFVYNEPTWNLPDGSRYDITVNDLCFVIGLRLRDKYLEEKGIAFNGNTKEK